MGKIQNDINIYYNKYLENIDKSKHLFEIKDLTLKEIKIKPGISIKNKYNFDMQKLTKKPIYYPLVIKDKDDYVMFDSFNQFLSYDEDMLVKCIILPEQIFKIENNQIKVIDSENIYFNEIYLNICDIHNKFFILYPYKNLLNKEYRLYIIKIYDYINLLEAISNLVELINQKLLIISLRGVK